MIILKPSQLPSPLSFFEEKNRLGNTSQGPVNLCQLFLLLMITIIEKGLVTFEYKIPSLWDRRLLKAGLL